MQGVHTALATINRCLNAHQPISRLPDDILVSIPTYLDSEVIQPDLVRLTRVCQSWRRTFISSSSLWSTIYVGALPLPLLSLSLKRSGSAPIRLDMARDDYHTFESVVTPIVNIQHNEYDTLGLDSVGWDEVVSVSRLASNSASNLRVLLLNITAAGRDNVALVPLPFSYASALQKLSLRLDSQKILDCFRFGSLIALSLFCTAAINQTKLLEFLRISPHLERVELDFHLLTGASRTGCPPVHLQDLRRLRINATTSGDSHLQLFTKIVCPVAKDVAISLHFVDLPGVETGSPLQFSWGFFPHSSQLHAVELQVGQTGVGTYSIRLLYGGGSQFKISFHFTSLAARIRHSFDRNTPRDLFIFRAILYSLHALSLNSVARLSITGIDPSTISDPAKPAVFSSIRELLAGMENLKTLTVSSGCVPAICLALSPQPAPSAILCPSLDSIELLPPIGPGVYKSVEEVIAMRKARATTGHVKRNRTRTFQKISKNFC